MLNGDVIKRSKPVPVTVHLSSMDKRFGRWRLAPSQRRFSSAVWIMAVKDGYCYFLIQKFQLNTHFYVQSLVSLVTSHMFCWDASIWRSRKFHACSVTFSGLMITLRHDLQRGGEISEGPPTGEYVSATAGLIRDRCVSREEQVDSHSAWKGCYRVYLTATLDTRRQRAAQACVCVCEREISRKCCDWQEM